MEYKTIGIILSVKKQWWLKVNTKPIRKHALDGATFVSIKRGNVNSKTVKTRMNNKRSPVREISICRDLHR